MCKCDVVGHFLMIKILSAILRFLQQAVAIGDEEVFVAGVVTVHVSVADAGYVQAFVAQSGSLSLHNEHNYGCNCFRERTYCESRET